MSSTQQSLSAYENGPYLEKALRYAVQHQVLNQEGLTAIINDASTGSVQIAEYFGHSAHLRQHLEDAKNKMVRLVSLYLEHTCDGDLFQAAQLLKDKPFRALSRGGSQMLKTLYALPEDSYFGSPRLESEAEFLKKQLTKGVTVAKYREHLKDGTLTKLKLNFATWLLKQMGANISAFSELHAPVEHVIRTCILSLAYGAKKAVSKGAHFPDESALLEIFTAIRKEWAFIGDVTSTKKFLSDIPAEFNEYGLQTLASIEADDIPKIVNASIPLQATFDQLKVSQYFFLYNPMDAVSKFDQMQADEWFTMTGGNEEDAVLLTLLLCSAAGMKPKPSLKASEAKKAVLAIRTHGFLEEEVLNLIDQAPHDEIDQLTALWQDFIDEANPYFQDKSDDKLVQVLSFLAHHCQITS
ncbi:MAG: hypothetical protein RL063_104 [Pseudomonadota bacterium]